MLKDFTIKVGFEKEGLAKIKLPCPHCGQTKLDCITSVEGDEMPNELYFVCDNCHEDTLVSLRSE